MQALIRIWDGLPFLARLLATAALALTVAGLAMVFVSAGNEASSSQTSLAIELEAELETLPAALSEMVVVGDYASLQQTLDRYVKRPRVAAITFRDNAGITLVSRDPEPPQKAPVWFRQFLHFDDIRAEAPVRVGGRSYGMLMVEMTARDSADMAWHRLGSHLAILILAVGMDFLGIWLVLRHGLAPLRHLEEGAARLAAGTLDIRLPLEGSPELRRVITGFNRMVSALEKAQRQIMARNRELVRFSEIAAHHLQEPTRRLYTFSQRLDSQIKKGDVVEVSVSLGFIREEAGRLRGLVRDIELYLAAGQPIGVLEPQDCAKAVERAVERLAPEIRAHGAMVEIGAMPQVILDHRRLVELFHITIENSLRYGRDGVAPRLAITGRSLPGGVELRISDNGRGIPPEFRERVFRVFERLDSLDAGTSTGVGLAILRRIAESTGGAVRIEDSPLGGITMVIELGQEDMA